MGDGRVDRIKALVRFEGNVAEHGAHGLALGPDGMIYVVTGNHAGITSEEAENMNTSQKMPSNHRYTAAGHKLRFWEGEASAEPHVPIRFRLGRIPALPKRRASVFGRAEYMTQNSPLILLNMCTHMQFRICSQTLRFVVRH